MADEDHLVGGPDYSQRRTALRGRVKRAPVNVGDAMVVVAINYSEAAAYEVPGSNWNAIGSEIPVEGTPCLIVFDDDGDAWIPTWLAVGSGGAPEPGSVERWFSGAGVPPGGFADSVVGDWYLNTTNGDVYEKTAPAAWTLRANLRGPQGIQGIQGDAGPAGPAGAAGAAGAAGTAGTPGEKWFAQAGAPANGTGIVGDWSLDTTNGDVYEKTGAAAWTLRGNIRGPAGAAGAPGAAGAAGPVGPTGYDTLPIGAVITWTSATLPASGEYVLADGQTLSAGTYPELDAHAAAEVAAGNPLWTRNVGAGTFTVPDLRNRFLYGAGARAVGVKSQTNPAVANPGEETHTLLARESGVNDLGSTTNSGSHDQNIANVTAADDLVNDASRIAGTNGGGVTSTLGAGTSSGAHSHPLTARTADLAHNNMPPYCVLAFLVKARGVSIDSGTIVGPQGPSGRTVLNGAGAPSNASGADGDFYIDTTNSRIYGPKAAGAWPGTFVSMIGPAGSNGSAGAAGTPGEKWFTGSGAPSGSLAGSIVGDWYLRSDTGDYYEKTGASSWTVRGNLTGPAGGVANKVVYGVINANGSIASGSGNFTITKGAAGLYTINFNAGGGASFGATPSVVVSPMVMVNRAAVTAVSASSASVNTGGSGGAPSNTDAAWTFIAIGVP